jgi:CDP-diglyceride synthetase
MLDTIFASPFCVSISSFSQQFYTLGWFAMSIFMILIIREQHQESYSLYIYQTIFFFLNGEIQGNFLTILVALVYYSDETGNFFDWRIVGNRMGKKKTKNNPPKNDQQFVGDLFLFGTAIYCYSHILYKRELLL